MAHVCHCLVANTTLSLCGRLGYASFSTDLRQMETAAHAMASLFPVYSPQAHLSFQSCQVPCVVICFREC